MSVHRSLPQNLTSKCRQCAAGNAATSWNTDCHPWGINIRVPKSYLHKQQASSVQRQLPLAAYLSELEVAGNICTPSGLAGTCLGGARYAGFEPRGRPRPIVFFADTRTKYGSPVSSSVMVYQREEEFVAPVPSIDADACKTGARIVADARLEGLRPRTEVPKSAVKFPLDPAYAWRGAGVRTTESDVRG